MNAPSEGILALAMMKFAAALQPDVWIRTGALPWGLANGDLVFGAIILGGCWSLLDNIRNVCQQHASVSLMVGSVQKLLPSFLIISFGMLWMLVSGADASLCAFFSSFSTHRYSFELGTSSNAKTKFDLHRGTRERPGCPDGSHQHGIDGGHVPHYCRAHDEFRV